MIHVHDPWFAHRPRKRGTVVDTLVLHATAGGSLVGALETLRKRKLSYHYIIDTNGDIHKLVPTSGVAFACGVSYGPQGRNCNEYTISVSFVNRNDGEDRYEPAQHKAAVQLAKDLKKAIPTLETFTTHYWISPGRKSDPKGYDVQQFAKETGLVAWKG